MAKMVLKDGKLIKKEDDNIENESGVPPQNINDVQQSNYQSGDEQQVYDREQLLKQELEQRQHEENNSERVQQYQQQLKQQAYEQQLKQQAYEQQLKQQQAYEQQLQQRQAYEQQLKQQQSDVVRVTIVMANSEKINIDVNSLEVEKFMEQLSEAINDSAAFPIGNKVINGRYVIMYY